MTYVALLLGSSFLVGCRPTTPRTSTITHAPIASVSVSAVPARPEILHLRLPPVAIATQRRAHYVVGTAALDKDALGGFGGSDRVPKPISGLPDLHFREGELQVLALTNQEVPFQEEEGDRSGFPVVIVNATGERHWLDASDSMLELVQEARDEKQTWRALEYRPSSWCGNSTHRVAIDPRQYWELTAPRFKGATLTRMRFKLTGIDTKQVVYSNEFDGYVELSQFSGKQGHQPANVMDPYNE